MLYKHIEGVSLGEHRLRQESEKIEVRIFLMIP